MFLVLFQYLLLASTFTLGKAVVQYASPIFFIGVRMILGGSLLLGYIVLFNRKSWKFTTQDLGAYVQLMLFHIYINFLCEFWSLQYVSSAKACLLYNLSPFVTALLSYYMFTERLTSKKWLGLAIGMLGFIPILYAQAPQEGIAGQFWGISLPELSLLTSVCSAAYAWLVIKKLVQQRGYSILMLNGIAMTSGGILAFITSLIVDGTPHIHCCAVPQDSLSVWMANLMGTQEVGLLMFIIYLLALLVIANIICFNVYGFLLKHYSATFLSFAGFTTPLFTAVWGWLLLGETIGQSFFVSLGITFAGLYLFYTEELNGRNKTGS
jgi:drug/metabolite transporter (DMT)-like permease